MTAGRRLFRRLAVLAVIVVAGGVSVWLRPGSGEALITEEVNRGDIETFVTAVGRLQPRAFVDVGAQASGQLRRLMVAVGDQVAVGQPLAELDPEVQNAKVAASRAELERLEAVLEEQQALADFDAAQLARNGALARRNAVSDLRLEESRRDMRTSAARVAATRAQIRQMQSTLRADEAALAYTSIDAPMAGTVLSIDAREGQTLNANYSAPQIMRIADLNTMTVWTEVSEADVTRLWVGMDVVFTTLGHGVRRWQAKLRQILPAPQKPDQTADSGAVSGNVVLYAALFDVENEGGALRPEMTAQVSFVTASAKDVVLAPLSALKDAAGEPFMTGDTAFVAVAAAGGVERRQIRLGLRDRFTAEVVAGLKAGERIVTGTGSGKAGPSRVGFSL
ncbi:efflux RND transporter periplasmic adaptor subunit [Paenirhodobacter sp.]|uniref:efflux RND transporter periplasmic adaptor subunit n=1 Tax=Paenirhodobacter sp. TaxID=1965326 RepID=UPI003B4230C4